MCGICGFLSRHGRTPEQLKQMNDTMVHRGPDDSGEELFCWHGGWQLGLAQRRLAILDLSPLGHQPMHSRDGRLSVVFNGEIYNFQELKKELSDYPFRSNCDTEVILAAWRRWGVSCVERFRGMFAIAVADHLEQRLYLVRDRIGKKPLYYWQQGGELVFASELKPILACSGFRGEIRRDVLSRYLYQQYINAPETIFSDVWKLEPGAVLTWEAGNISVRKYWDIRDVYARCQKDIVSDYGQAREGLKERLKTAVAERMIADVPLGTFLSGGYDSSLVTAIAQECAEKPVKTFSIGFREERYNEARYAKRVAEYLGCDHTELYIGEKEMFDLVESIPQYYDEPFADSSQIPSMLVAGLARRDVTVALSGDGGDEFFCGYNIYQMLAKAQRLDPAGGLLYRLLEMPGLRRLPVLQRLPFRVRIIAQNRNRSTKVQFGVDNYVICAEKMVENGRGGLPCHYEVEEEYPVRDWQIKRMLLDMDTYLPGDILCKVDRASMKYSLETRCPILDRDVMEYSFRIPHSFKYCRGDKKHILKDIAREYIPGELLDRPKTGFGVPLDQWLRGPLRQPLLDCSGMDFLRRQGLFNADYVQEMLRGYLAKGDGGASSGANYSRLVWAFFVFQQWYSRYMSDCGKN